MGRRRRFLRISKKRRKLWATKQRRRLRRTTANLASASCAGINFIFIPNLMRGNGLQFWQTAVWLRVPSWQGSRISPLKCSYSSLHASCIVSACFTECLIFFKVHLPSKLKKLQSLANNVAGSEAWWTTCTGTTATTSHGSAPTAQPRLHLSRRCTGKPYASFWNTSCVV